MDRPVAAYDDGVTTHPTVTWRDIAELQVEANLLWGRIENERDLQIALGLEMRALTLALSIGRCH